MSSNKKQKRSRSPRPRSPTGDVVKPSGLLVTCSDVPTKQFIMYLNEKKPADKKFVIQDLDATHVLIKSKARNEIIDKLEKFMDSNVFSAVEKVGEDLDVS